MTARFHRRRGRVVARFSRSEAGVLRQAVDEVMTLLGGPQPVSEDPLDALLGPQASEPGPPTDPALARLLPDGYRDDAEAAAELRRLTESSVRAAKVGQAQRLLGDLPADGGDVALDDESASAWLGALNDVRLALGTRLDVTEEMDPDAEIRADPGSERSYGLAVYGWLTWLQETLVQALSGRR